MESEVQDGNQGERCRVHGSSPGWGVFLDP